MVSRRLEASKHLAAFRWHRNGGSTHATVVQDLALLREVNEEMIRISVVAMYDAGYSWSEVGQALGVSRQAAQQRYGTVTK